MGTKMHFNTAEMRIMVFDMNEDQRTVVPLTEPSMTKLIKGLTYAIERAQNREIDVRFYCVMDPDTRISTDQSLKIMEHLRDSGVDVLFTSLDLVIGRNDQRDKIAFNFLGGNSNAGFIKAIIKTEEEDEDNNGSQFTGYVDEGLTQLNAF